MRSKNLTLTLSFLLMSVLEALAAPPTMRLDYYHTGSATPELFSVDRVVVAAYGRQARETAEHCLSDGPHANKVGAFQGAMYQNNYYRPQQRCIMLSGDTFCAAPWSAGAKLPPWNPREKAVACATALQRAFGASTNFQRSRACPSAHGHPETMKMD